MATLTEARIGELPPPGDEAALEDYLAMPDAGTIETMRGLREDLLVLGAGGKLGFSLCNLARRAIEAAEVSHRVIAVSRFSDPIAAAKFAEAGIDTLSVDLVAEGALERLPDASDVVFLAGMKFGTAGSPGQTWALNVFLPGLVARRFKNARIAALSTGNVYAFADARTCGGVETDEPAPIGDYAMSCLGRERMLQHFSHQNGTPVTLVRLNYANDLRYGVVLDLAQKVAAGQAIDLTMGYVNVIWQGDANAATLRALDLAASPPAILNVTGPETLAVRWLATELAKLLEVPPPTFVGTEAPTALLNNASKCHALFGYPRVPLGTLLAWTVHWVRHGGRTLNKPTHFEARDGKF